MVYMIVGTGVGIAIIADGEIYRGQHNSAGEFGHTTMDRSARSVRAARAAAWRPS
jgi:predicted NBD/HSP70 family sugar kinase